MKKLDSYHVVMARYFFWAGAVLLLLGSVLSEGQMLRFLGACMALAGAVVDCGALLRELRFKHHAAARTPEQVTVRIPAPSAVHIRGLFFFTLECTCGGQTVTGPLMALPRWSRFVRSNALSAQPKVTVYTRGGKTLIEAYI
ncbi:MAG: hypothetical protein Q4F17_10485 [Eubacteriales bacterium]|nr:hypothetical protein [Eubacteriales bacterium]